MTEASIIILTRNRENLLRECLSSLLININSHYEIIVIDNGSIDGASDMLKKNYKKIKLIKKKRNVGVAAGRNLGVRKSNGKYIIFLDDDTFVTGDPFSKIIEFMKKCKDVGIVGPKLLYANGKVQESARIFPTPLSILWRGTFLYKVFPDTPFYKKYILKDFNHKRILEVDWVMGACQVVRKEVFDMIGLLDENYFYGYEDIDFCYRAKNAGWKVVYYPYSKIIHYYARESARVIINRQKLEHVKGIMYFFSKKYFKIGS